MLPVQHKHNHPHKHQQRYRKEKKLQHAAIQQCMSAKGSLCAADVAACMLTNHHMVLRWCVALEPCPVCRPKPWILLLLLQLHQLAAGTSPSRASPSTAMIVSDPVGRRTNRTCWGGPGHRTRRGSTSSTRLQRHIGPKGRRKQTLESQMVEQQDTAVHP